MYSLNYLIALTILINWSPSVECAGFQSAVNQLPSLSSLSQSLPSLSSFSFPTFGRNLVCLGGISLSAGTCETENDCQSSGRFSEASAACIGSELKCCIPAMTCDGQTFTNGTVFTNPSYPKTSSEARICRFQVNKVNLDVQQLRLEIISMSLSQPGDSGCKRDALTIQGIGDDAHIPLICGNNANQHIYVPVAGLPGPFIIEVGTSGIDVQRSWAIRIVQLTHQNVLARSGCLQYYTDVSSTFESFNNGYSMIAGLNYAVCVELQNGYCSISYDTQEFNLIPGNGNTCPSDYIRFPPSASSNGLQCGVQFNNGNQLVSKKGGPQIIYIGSNGKQRGKGLKVIYTQNICKI